VNNIAFQYGKDIINIPLQGDVDTYLPGYKKNSSPAAEVVSRAVAKPVGKQPLIRDLKDKWNGTGNIVIVVSDITRPIAYKTFLPPLLQDIEQAGIVKEKIIILVATGMHRPSKKEERVEMFGEEVASRYCIIDHKADDPDELKTVPGKSKEGLDIILNRHYVDAGYRIITSLVEPHFMAGFSGGRKTVCPGLSSLETIRRFHGYDMLDHPQVQSALLHNNPCHEEAFSVAKAAPPDYAINIIQDKHRNVVEAFAGDYIQSYEEAVKVVSRAACKKVEEPADVVITSCGGYPLDTTFYQCVKGFVACLPAVKKGGEIIAFGSCTEGIGSDEYEGLMKQYNGNWQQFMKDYQDPGCFVKDQWQYQMHIRTLKKIGVNHLHFITDAFPKSELDMLSVNGYAVKKEDIAATISRLTKRDIKSRIAVFPEGPYCVAV
jgi:lactate racemase